MSDSRADAGPGPADQVPPKVLRQWSDGLAAAGLFSEALGLHPAAERADIVRRAELAVLAGDHQLALHLLAELDAARTARTARPTRLKRAGPKGSEPVGPWLGLLTCCAQLLAGQPNRLPAVLKAAKRVTPSAGVSWVVALTAAVAGALDQAAPAAAEARAGGCRDLRMLAILAAERASTGDDQAALMLVAEALAVALPDEDPAGFVVDLLDRAGFRAVAQRLAAAGAGDGSRSAAVRLAWKQSARRVGTGHARVLRSSLRAAGQLGSRQRQRRERRLRDDTLRDLTCRCYGSAGWIGEDRLHYVNQHLSEVLAAPVAGLDARLLRCRATNLTFLDLAQRQFTLPVVSELPPPPTPTGSTDSSGKELDDADPEGQPTPGMGVSLGIVLNP